MAPSIYRLAQACFIANALILPGALADSHETTTTATTTLPTTAWPTPSIPTNINPLSSTVSGPDSTMTVSAPARGGKNTATGTASSSAQPTGESSSGDNSGTAASTVSSMSAAALVAAIAGLMVCVPL